MEDRHPQAEVPDRLLADPEADARWRRRYSAVRISLADPARDAPGRTCFVSNATGRFELYCWDVAGDVEQQATDRSDGTVYGALDPAGQRLFWFDDTDGDEFGRWRVQDFGAAPGPADEAWPAVPPGYPSGLELGTGVHLAGFADDDGSRVHLTVAAPDGERQPGSSRVVYRNANDASVGALSRDETIWVLSHSEGGDSRYPALRALSVETGDVIGELDDTPGKGLSAIDFARQSGDQRLLVGHERRGRDELLIWDPTSGSVSELEIPLPGDLSGTFFHDGRALLILHTHSGRDTLHRYDLITGELTDLPAVPGAVAGALTRPDGVVWYRWSSAAFPAQLRELAPDGTDRTLLRPPGEPAPQSEPVRDLWTDGPGGRIHSLLGLPHGAELPDAVDPGVPHPGGPWPTVFYLHGGPAAGDEDSYDATRAAWLDAGFVVVQVNYRGSTGYGSAWRDALTERVGHVELADVAAVHDDLIGRGIADPSRSVVTGGSWGGFLSLLALGTQPDRWAAGVAAVPVADYVQAYQDEMEPLRAYDRALFGGSPEDKPDAYRDSSPISYVHAVRAPVLILAGENDPRCPIRQVDTYLDALAERGAEYAVYRFDAGHGSMVVDERIRQVACEIAFARSVVDRVPVTAGNS